MDISDSEPSDRDAEDDDREWEHSDPDESDRDPESVDPSRKQQRKRNSATEVCCSCSKMSLCKTKRCQCRAAGDSCGVACGCEATKCSNREADAVKGDPILVEGNDETENSLGLASQGAMLLQSALADKPAKSSDEAPRRKPLSDIGNTQAKSNAEQKPRKQWRRSVIQLVPVAPSSSTQPETIESLKKPESSEIESNIPLKLPRGIRSAAQNNPLRERNSDQPDGSVVNKEASGPAPRSPHQQARTTDEKENRGL